MFRVLPKAEHILTRLSDLLMTRNGNASKSSAKRSSLGGKHVSRSPASYYCASKPGIWHLKFNQGGARAPGEYSTAQTAVHSTTETLQACP